ncbi:thioredoxin family protein [Methylomonas sp. Kb3]|uniref:protein-disulfide reductase DsbD family protein n=1 Tax=Methylomonas sp. Kb3 TaxID=1611544 RepID=UPI001F0C1DA2|nr:thioredoxin family protein [Methylomonas sp. Kb3]
MLIVYRVILGIILVLGMPCTQANPSPEAATDQVSASLIASHTAVHPGDEILIGVHHQIIPHWHTYWKNPGDSGLPTKIQYQLPAGWSVGEIQWPTPSKIVLGPVVNYGYHDAVTLLSPLRVAENAEPGTEWPISAKAKWLVCEEACIPQEVELAIQLPVVAKGVAVGPTHPLIAAAQNSLPGVLPWQASLLEGPAGTLRLHLTGEQLPAPDQHALAFYPDQWGPISHAGEQITSLADDGLDIRLPSGDQLLSPGQTLTGVLTVASGDSLRAYQISAAWPGTANPVQAEPASALAEQTLPTALLLALAGGLILNLMPCVFPVLSLKALALIEQAAHDPGKTRRHGWAYLAGILISFTALAAVLVALKAGGAGIGWGFQFQSPWFVTILAYLIFAVGLSLSGVFNIGTGITGLGHKLATLDGYAGSFFTGVLAAVVATPCTAPFMGAAIGFAITQAPATMIAVFLSLGIGLALPYWLLCQWPILQRWLPKPGAWMETLKQGLAFPMYATAAWLIWVLARQAGPEAVAGTLGGCVLVALAVWLLQISRNATQIKRRVIHTSAGVTLLLALLAGELGIQTSSQASYATDSNNQHWQAYSAEKLAQLRSEGKPVFVNFTADWCITCLVNERVALSSESVRGAFLKAEVTYLKGDWTNRDAGIAKVLSQFGRSGVPLYLYFGPGAQEAMVLPQILTPDLVIGAIQSARL